MSYGNYDSKQTDPLIGTANSRPPPFNADYGAPPQYSQGDPRLYQYQQQPQYGGGYGTTNVVVVTQPVNRVVPINRQSFAPDYMGLSIFMLVCCLLCGTWTALICAIPALVLSIIAHDHNASGNFDEALRTGKLALGCNIAALVNGVLVVIAIVIYVIVQFTALDTSTYYNNNNY